MKISIILIDELIYRIKKNEQFHNCLLYLREFTIKSGDEIMVILDDEYDADEIIQDFRSCIGMDAVNQVVENLDEQAKNPTLDDYVEAINYYIENDAFIDKENPDNKLQGGYKIWGMAETSDKPDI